ncbi:peptide deformylase [Aminicella lysinilytica]|uniref:Peptide deformylase n=1 Tax=Aminicella lysinilytica TaxID=433323 RepID=A0A4R6Q6R8_9FIRM|nr:peptide deformylase [Aminicella lysinilytica]TDP57496.1 peptide deformylase [Aminicella lysinilytica]
MAIRNIVRQGDPILRKHCREITDVNEHIRTTMEDMVDTMRSEFGVGLAGPQVGVMRRMFVAEPEPDRVYYMINPEIIEQSGSQVGEEGCLSIPGLIGQVERPMKIKIKALDLDGNMQEYDLEGFDARVMCHENDHLDGILYTDTATDVHDPMEDIQEEEEK